FAALLIGCCVGPIVLMGIVYDPAYRGPIDAGDLGKCVSIFHVLAIVFAGTHTATEINAGSTRSEEHTSELQSRFELVCRLLLEKKNTSQEVIDICDERTSAQDIPNFTDR